MSTKFTIVVGGERSSLRVEAEAGVAPAAALRAAISALQAELEELQRCPIHRALDAGAPATVVKHGVTMPAAVWARIENGVPPDYTEEEYRSYSAIQLARENAALGVSMVDGQTQQWRGLTKDEIDHEVGELVALGTEFVAPLYAAVEGIGRKLRERNDGRTVGGVSNPTVVHHVDWLGLALDLEVQARRVESQTVERAMLAGAHGLRLMGADGVSAPAPEVPASSAGEQR